MSRLAAFMVTYQRPRALEESLRAFLDQTRRPEQILVIDNGEGREGERVARSFSSEGVAYEACGENLGPAGASARAIERLVREGFDWICFGDDDDPPLRSDMMARLMAIAEGHDELGAVGSVGTRFDWRVGERIRLDDDELKGLVDVDVIGGGKMLIVSRVAAERAGVPDGRLFFGGYEPEYCLRIRRAGLRLVVDGDLMRELREAYGRTNMRSKRSLVSTYAYDSLWRRYYRTRNYIFMMRRTFGRADLARREAAKALGRCGFSWLRGRAYGARFSHLQVRGVVDGYRDRMGRTIAPAQKVGQEHDAL